MRRTLALLISTAALLAACATAPPRGLAPLSLAPLVDVARFMGDWYVIAAIATVFEREAHNPVETYRLDADGSIATTFSFNAGGFDGARQRFESRGIVVPGSGNAVWTQQYVWPFRADYRIAYVTPDYGQVVVAREKRDYVWIMARTPTIPADDLARLTAFVAAQGYDTDRLKRMPHAAGR
jgi:apolipoprotein D and lipocalin family protein